MKEAVETKERTYEEMLNDFNQLAYQSGKISYEIAQKIKDVDNFHNAMRDLSVKAAALKAKEPAVKEVIEAPKDVTNES